MNLRLFIIGLAFALAPVAHADFLMWLDGPTGRSNAYDPKSPNFAPIPTAFIAPALSPTFSLTFSPSPTRTQTATQSPSFTETPSFTVTETYNLSDTLTQTMTESPNYSPTPTITPTFSPSLTVTRTPTPTFSPSLTATLTSTPAPRGAVLPYEELEAEAATTNGVIIGPSRTLYSIAAESSGRQAVQLNSTGQYVTFNSGPAFNSIVVRYVIPDAPGGGGLSATLSLYINGAFVQTLNLTSKYAWAYGGFSIPYSQNPASGSPIHTYDEVHALLPSNYAAGSTVTLQRNAGDTAAYYVVDLIDLEQVGPALSQPANSYSVVSYGATPNDATDDTTAIQACIDAAQAAGKSTWFPAGTYEISNSLVVSWGTVQGAGMWRTTVHQNSDVSVIGMNLSGTSCAISDLLLLGEVSARDDTKADSALEGHAGTNSTMQRVWIEHTKCGWWVGNTGSVTNNLTISDCRMRDLYADGVNFCNGTSNSTISNCNFRSTGDDAMASWSPAADGINSNNLFSFNTVQQPWRANCAAIYGGANNKIEDNLFLDTLNYPGILIGQEFTSHSFSGTTSVQRNTLTRCGGFYGGNNQGALKISAQDGAISGVLCQDLDILDSTYEGIYVSGGNNVSGTTFNRINITTASTYGMQTTGFTGGTINCSYVVVTGAAFGGLINPGGLNFVKVIGNSGW